MAEKDAPAQVADEPETEFAEATWSQDDQKPPPEKEAPPDDAGDEFEADDDPDGEDAGEDDAVDDDAEPAAAKSADTAQPRNRARDRIQTLERERDAARAAETAANARAAERQTADAARERADNDARERALMEQMSEGERAQYLIAKEVKNTQQRQDRIEADIADSRDAAAFSRLLATDKTAGRFAERVEAEHAKLRKAGINTSREAVLTFLVGDAVRKGQLEAGTTQRKAAKQRVSAERAPARRAATDTAPRRGGESRVSRMERDDPAI